MKTLSENILYHLTETDCISDSDLVQAALGVDKEVADQLLKEVGGVTGLASASTEDLCKVDGITEDHVAQLRAIALLTHRMLKKSLQGKKFTSPFGVVNHYQEKLSAEAQESFWALYLDARNRVIGEAMISKGTQKFCQVGPADIYRSALKVGALSVILVHNHPSGDPQPSEEDKELTRRISKVGEELGIQILDHIVIASTGHYSFADHGVL